MHPPEALHWPAWSSLVLAASLALTPRLHASAPLAADRGASCCFWPRHTHTSTYAADVCACLDTRIHLGRSATLDPAKAQHGPRTHMRAGPQQVRPNKTRTDSVRTWARYGCIHTQQETLCARDSGAVHETARSTRPAPLSVNCHSPASHSSS